MEGAIRISEKYSMPRFDTYNRRKYYPLLEYVRESGNERAMVCSEWRSSILSSIKPDFNRLFVDVDAAEMRSLSGHRRFVGFPKWVGAAEELGKHKP